MRVVLISGALALLLGQAALAGTSDDAAKCHVLAGDSGARVAACTRAIKSDSLSKDDLADAYNNRGVAHSAGGRYRMAIADFDAALGIVPDLAPALSNRCEANLRMGDFRQAVADCDAALKLRPDDAYAYLNRGSAHLASGLRVEAANDYRKAFVLKPDNPVIRSAMTRMGVRP